MIIRHWKVNKYHAKINTQDKNGICVRASACVCVCVCVRMFTRFYSALCINTYLLVF